MPAWLWWSDSPDLAHEAGAFPLDLIAFSAPCDVHMRIIHELTPGFGG